MHSILVVEDSAEMRLLISDALRDFDLSECGSIEAARERLATSQFDLVILDLTLPDGDGLTLLPEAGAPVIVLSGRLDVAQKVVAFKLGAEDYVTKPFSMQELRARVESKISKHSREKNGLESLRLGDLVLDGPRQSIVIKCPTQDDDVQCTSLEFRLLWSMARAPGRVLSRDHLLESAWGKTVHVGDRTVDAHISHLRKKLEKSKVRIETVVGSGYRLSIVGDL
jgi:DNA-binding response OmpR family regulator